MVQIWNRFSGKRKSFSKNWSSAPSLKALRLTTHHFHAKLPCQKTMLRQIKPWLQNGPITKNGVLPVTALVFLKFYFSLRTFYKELICCTSCPNAHIFTFCKRWSSIWRCFYHVNILKSTLMQIWKSLYMF